MEIWKDIPGYEGYYQVSNLGRVKSLERKIKHWQGGFRLKKELILSNLTDKDGYFRVNLYDKNSKLKHWSIHQLVCICFLNHTPKGNTLVVNHKNFNKKDNRLENLEIVSNRENTNKKHLNSSSKYTGVSFSKRLNKFQAEISYKKKRFYLGVFESEKEASLAYQKKLKEIKNGIKISN